MLPLEQPGALKGQFGFVETNGHFDLPSASISVHDVPGVLRAVDGLGGEQIPGGLLLAACHNEPERLVMDRIGDRESNDPDLAMAASAGIPQHTVLPGALALTDFTRFTKLVILIQ